MAGKGGYSELDISKFIAADKAGKLSTKDRKFVNKMKTATKLTDDEIAAEIEQDLRPENLIDLATEIAGTKHPVKKAILLQEQDRLLTLLKQQNEAQLQQVDTPSILNQIGNYFQKLWSSQ